MIINCGKRRLVSYEYGWRIEIEKTKSEKSALAGQKYWAEDSPAYPATLAQACEMVWERELKEMPDVDITHLPEALKTAAATVRKYMQCARQAA
jgi:hypothetical protein